MQQSRPDYNAYGSSYASPNNTSQFTYGTPSYKEREAFYDKLNSLLKENKSTQAMDHISTHLNKMCEEKRFEDLDVLLRLITFDKLNVPAMLNILDATKAFDNSLKARSEFFGKVKIYLKKIKPIKSDDLLKGLEPQICS